MLAFIHFTDHSSNTIDPIGFEQIVQNFLILLFLLIKSSAVTVFPTASETEGRENYRKPVNGFNPLLVRLYIIAICMTTYEYIHSMLLIYFELISVHNKTFL